MDLGFIVAVTLYLAVYGIATWLPAINQSRVTVFRLAIVPPVVGLAASIPWAAYFSLNPDAAFDRSYPQLAKFIDIAAEERVFITIGGTALNLAYLFAPVLAATALCGRRLTLHSGIGPVRLSVAQTSVVAKFSRLVCFGGLLLFAYVAITGVESTLATAWSNRAGLATEGANPLFLLASYCLFTGSNCAIGLVAATTPDKSTYIVSMRGAALLLTNILAAFCVAGRGNMCVFVLWFGLGRAIQVGRLFPFMAAIAIFSLCSLFAPLYHPMKSAVTSPAAEFEIDEAAVEKISAEHPSRAFNDFSSRVTLFKHSYLLGDWSRAANIENWTKSPQMATMLIKEEFAEEREASQPVRLLESSLLLAGLPGLVFATLLLAMVLIWLSRISRAIDTPSGIVLLFLGYWTYYLQLSASPGLGAILLQFAFIPILLLSTIRTCSKIPSIP
jgi:hypothetical protein